MQKAEAEVAGGMRAQRRKRRAGWGDKLLGLSDYSRGRRRRRCLARIRKHELRAPTRVPGNALTVPSSPPRRLPLVPLMRCVCYHPGPVGESHDFVMCTYLFTCFHQTISKKASGRSARTAGDKRNNHGRRWLFA